MTTREVCFLIDPAGAIVYADASTSPVALPDARARWEAIWAAATAGRLAIVAHSHPVGPAAFSAEDRSTMAALDSALGRVVRYVVVTPDLAIVADGADGEALPLDPEPWWTTVLRLASGLATKG